MIESESYSVVSDSLQPHGLSVEFSRLEYWTANPGIEPRSPTLQADSLPAEPQRKPKNTGVGSLYLLQQIFLTQESNWGLLHCRQIPYHLSYQGSLHIYVENILDNHIIYLYLSIYETFGAFTV